MPSSDLTPEVLDHLEELRHETHFDCESDPDRCFCICHRADLITAARKGLALRAEVERLRERVLAVAEAYERGFLPAVAANIRAALSPAPTKEVKFR